MHVSRMMTSFVDSGPQKISMSTTIAPIIVASINRAAARIQKPIYSGSAGRNHPMGMPAGAPHSGQNWASGGNSVKQLEQPPFSGRVGCPQWTQKLTLAGFLP